ncbi:DegT/DnrJ/EryC1/StrS family aminotransferase [bacterium]|nr:DegT/DnrJ/EryC1/StrS family aminotransferase [bacterium]
MKDKPAIFGGSPIFEREMNIVSPTLPKLADIRERITEILSTGNLTNDSRYVRELEREIAKFLGVEHAVAVANATLGLMLVLQALDLKGEVIVPSFTFSATVHALMWNGLRPVFVDIDPDTYNLDPSCVAESITPETSAIMAVHVFGNPCNIEALERVAHDHGLKLIFDSAHAFGSSYNGREIGRFGDAEVFSFHATKMLPAGEGGVVATNDDQLRQRLSWGRNFGNPGDDDCRFAGLNAKMTEFSAILGLEGLKRIEAHICHRNEVANLFMARLSRVPGLTFQKITPGCQSTYQFFSILIDPNTFGLNRDQLNQALRRENIVTRKYFYPPMHRHRAYQEFKDQYNGQLPVTGAVSNNILCLPICSHMIYEDVEKIALAIERIHHYHNEVQRKCRVC